ncbi:MAG: hypothetical protein A2V90_06190 [Gammaproteobacteria bacterium RBG_16_57_12]|nr:MAG: hypothetical protein A2V90_06190 [Gammaproteobacteria bacterium RBG_16_57_12]
MGERVLLTLWVGGMWTVGYIAAPMLFKVLDDRQLAGMLAGHLFQGISVIGLLAGTLLLLLGMMAKAQRPWQRRWQTWVLLSMVLITALFQFGLQPMLEDLKQRGLNDPSVAAQFGRLHGASAVLYLINSLSGLALVCGGLSWRTRTEV